MEKTIKQDDAVMKILDVSIIQRFICDTNKGALKLEIRKGEKEYHLVLDAVPLSKDQNKELMAILFPAQKIEVPQVNKLNGLTTGTAVPVPMNVLPPKKLGRPKGSKDGIKDMK